MKPTPESIIAGIPAWHGKAVQYEPLNGGFSNDTYRLQAGGDLFALRINGTQNEFLGLDRCLEVEAVKRAYALGIAPEPVYCEGRTDVLITRFLPGRMVSPAQAHEPSMITRMAETLKIIHAMPGPNRSMGSFEIIERYLIAAGKLGMALPEGLAPHLHRMEKIAQSRSREPSSIARYCHNDFFTFNMIYDEDDVLAPTRIRMIDWELSGWGDVFLDLTPLPYTNNYTDEESRLLLTAYFGFCDDDLLHTLHQMCFVSLIREIAWALLHAAIVKDPVNHTLDYMGFVNYVITRLDAGKITLSGE